jgi:uncharacterized MAPEG superfamily protein
MGVQIPVELKLLMVAVIIGFVQIVWAATAGSGGERDFAWLAGPRDDPKPVGVVAARLGRALSNFLETFPLFAAALIACDLAGTLCAALCLRHRAGPDTRLDGQHRRHRDDYRGFLQVILLA